jgi:hypothetical protein
MGKKGEFNNVFIYLLITLIALIVILYGYKVINDFLEKECQVKRIIVKEDLQQEFDTLGIGSLKRKVYENLCRTDKIYFFDKSKNLTPDHFNDSLVLKDIIESKPKENVFFMEKIELKNSFNVGKLDIEYPYYKCILIKNNKLDFFIRGKGSGINIINKNPSLDCTYIAINPDSKKAEDILRNFSDFGCDLCPSGIDFDMRFFNKTKENVDMKRKVICDETSGLTDVEIVIKVKKGYDLHNFNFYEVLPKECVNQISKDLVAAIPGVEINVSEDPLIMWHLGKIEDEQVLSYKIETCLSNECSEMIAGLGIARYVTVDDANPNNKAPVTTTPPDISFSEDNTMSLDLDDYVDDPDNPDNELTWEYIGGSFIHVNINQETHEVTFIPEPNWYGSEIKTFRVKDPYGEYDIVEVSVTVTPIDDKPSIEPISKTTARVGELYEYQVEASDPDGDDLTYSLIEKPTGMDIDGKNGLITWTPNKHQKGENNVVVEVNDENGNSELQAFTITVNCITSESICNDGYDNDCDGEIDYDGYTDGFINPPVHGDDDCKVEIKKIVVNNANPIENSMIKVKCQVNTNKINSILAYLDSSLCSFSRWEGSSNVAEFECNVGSYTGNKKINHINKLVIKQQK